MCYKYKVSNMCQPLFEIFREKTAQRYLHKRNTEIPYNTYKEVQL